MYAFLGLISVILVFTDLKYKQLPNVVTLSSYPILALLLVGASISTPDGSANLIRAGLASFTLFTLFAGLHALNREGLGMGDAKLAPTIGAVLGWNSWSQVWAGTAIAFISAGLVALFLVLAKRLTRKDEIAYGPFMILGLWVALSQTI